MSKAKQPPPFFGEFEQLTGLAMLPRRSNTLAMRLPRVDQLFRRIALICFDQPKIGQALKRRLPQWLKQAPGEEVTWALAGYVYYCLEDYPKAEAAFTKAIELAPDNLDNWLDLGMALRHQANPLGVALLVDYNEFIQAYRLRKLRALDRSILSSLRRSIVEADKDYLSVYANYLFK